MKVIHPDTKNTLIMVEGLESIAEIDAERACDEDMDFVSVTFGEVGYSQCLIVYRKDWDAFKRLVAEINAEWAT